MLRACFILVLFMFFALFTSLLHLKDIFVCSRVIGCHCTVVHFCCNSAVRQCRDVSKNRFDQDSTIGQTFGHASNANGLAKINGHNMVHGYDFNTT